MDRNFLMDHSAILRDMGADNIYCKMAGYDRVDIERVIRIASEAQVDMSTFFNPVISGMIDVKLRKDLIKD